MTISGATGGLYASLIGRQSTGNRATIAATMASGGQEPAAGGSSRGVSSYDFTNMTKNQMVEASRQLQSGGVIDLTQAGMLQMAGPLGKVGRNGEFVPFTAAEREALGNQPMNYIQTAQEAIAGIESRGEAGNPKSGYADWKQILAVLQSRQGTPSGVDIKA
ncbi:MAG: hypothetical protein J0H01_36370 [Rhizobiales bacterium]|nr:hypothetical protein [Hyphomicrobiales bacterium]